MSGRLTRQIVDTDTNGNGWQPRVSALETSVSNMEGNIKEIKILLERRQLPVSTILTLIGMVGMFATVVLGAVMIPSHIQHQNLESNVNKSISSIEGAISGLQKLADSNLNGVSTMRERFLGSFEEIEGQISGANSIFSLTWDHQQRLNQLIWKKLFNEDLPPLQDGLVLAPTRRSRR